MNAESFFVQYTDDGPVYHGAVDCDYGDGQRFICRQCLRDICWCGGHDGGGVEGCPHNCARCDECCTPRK